MGFNIIDLEIPKGSNLVRVAVHRYTSLNGSPKGAKLKFLLPRKPLDKISRELLYATTHWICSGGELRNRIGELFRKKTERGHFARIRDVHTEVADIRGIYSVTVFPPKLWGTKNFAELFLPQGKRNIAHAVAVAKRNEFHLRENESLKKRLNEGHASLHFLFSDPLCKAIQNSLRISQKLKVATRLRELLEDDNFHKTLDTQVIDFLQRCFRPNHTNTSSDAFSSLSIWDNAGRMPNVDLSRLVENQPDEDELDEIIRTMVQLPSIGEMRVTISPLGAIPRFSFGENDIARDTVALLFEFPRILIWDDKWLNELEAFQCIEFHEECAMPLFWLRPSRLLTRKKGKTRRPVGHVTLFATRDPSGNLLREAKSLWNDRKGKEPSLRKSFSEIQHIWGKEAYPKSLDPHEKLVEEFMYLLQRPDIVFAADAWAMRLLGEDAWNEFMNLLDAINCSTWLNE